MTRLTIRRIRGAKPRQRRYEMSCSQTRGLLIRVLPSGKKVFFVRVRDGNTDTKIRLGLFGDGDGGTLTLADARGEAKRIAHETYEAPPHAARTTPRSAPPPRAHAAPPEPESVPFRAVVDDYLRLHVNSGSLRPTTAVTYRHALRTYVRAWGDRPISTLRLRDVEEIHRAMRDRPSAANAHVRVLHHLFEKAIAWELLDGRNPAARLTMYRETPRKRYLSPVERERMNLVLTRMLRDTASRRSTARWSHVYAIRLLAMTGFRLGEVLDLEWTWIDRDNLRVLLPDTKTGQSERPISPAVLELLDELTRYRKPHIPWVVYGRHGQRIKKSSLRHMWGRVRTLAGIEDVRVHDLRHSAASAAISNGCTLQEVGAILGHKKAATTARYAHLADDAARRAAQRMTDAMVAPPRRARGNRTKR